MSITTGNDLVSTIARPKQCMIVNQGKSTESHRMLLYALTICTTNESTYLRVYNKNILEIDIETKRTSSRHNAQSCGRKHKGRELFKQKSMKQVIQESDELPQSLR